MSEQTATVTTDDLRIQEIADFTGESPQEVLDEATEYAALDGVSVSEELDGTVATVEMIEEIENGDETDDDDESGDDLTGWSEGYDPEC